MTSKIPNSSRRDAWTSSWPIGSLIIPGPFHPRWRVSSRHHKGFWDFGSLQLPWDKQLKHKKHKKKHTHADFFIKSFQLGLKKWICWLWPSYKDPCIISTDYTMFLCIFTLPCDSHHENFTPLHSSRTKLQRAKAWCEAWDICVKSFIVDEGILIKPKSLKKMKFIITSFGSSRAKSHMCSIGTRRNRVQINPPCD
jgi:hypothetical protein